MVDGICGASYHGDRKKAIVRIVLFWNRIIYLNDDYDVPLQQDVEVAAFADDTAFLSRSSDAAEHCGDPS